MGAAIGKGSSGEIWGWYHPRALSGIDPSGAFPFSFSFHSAIPSSVSILGPKRTLDHWIRIDHTMAIWIRAK